MRSLIAITIWLFLTLPRSEAGLSPVIAEFPFQFREGLIWIEVRTPESSQPLNFMVDSGAQVSVINLAVARRLGLMLGGLVSVRGVNANASGYWPEHLSARLGDVMLPRDFLAVDLCQLSQACGCGVDGLLGADFFKGRRVQIDFQRQKIRLLRPAPPGKDEESLPLTAHSGGMLVKLQVNNNKPQNVRLDTGCATALQWVAVEIPSGPCARQIAVGMTRISMPLIHATVRLGRSEFKSVPTGLQDHQIFSGEAGLLGAPLLANFAVVTVDAPAKRLLLKQYR
jgi:hypothetical protein